MPWFVKLQYRRSKSFLYLKKLQLNLGDKLFGKIFHSELKFEERISKICNIVKKPLILFTVLLIT